MTVPPYPAPPPRRRGPASRGTVVAVIAGLLVVAVLVAAVVAGLRFGDYVDDSDVADPYSDLGTTSDPSPAAYDWVTVGDLEFRVVGPEPCLPVSRGASTTTCPFVVDVRNVSSRTATVAAANVGGLLGPGVLRFAAASVTEEATGAREVEVAPGEERRIVVSVVVPEGSGPGAVAALLLDDGDAADDADGVAVSVRVD